MIDLDIEYSKAEQEYDLAAFDADPNMVYELTVRFPASGIIDEIVSERQTMNEIKTEIQLLGNSMSSKMAGIMVIAYEVDDSRPVPAYMLIQKELKG